MKRKLKVPQSWVSSEALPKLNYAYVVYVLVTKFCSLNRKYTPQYRSFIFPFFNAKSIYKAINVRHVDNTCTYFIGILCVWPDTMCFAGEDRDGDGCTRPCDIVPVTVLSRVARNTHNASLCRRISAYKSISQPNVCWPQTYLFSLFLLASQYKFIRCQVLSRVD